MLIEMLIQIDGYREGAPWPGPGDTVDIPDGEAAELIACRYARVPEEPPGGDELAAPPRASKARAARAKK